MTPGSRLREARELTHLTRTKFCKKHDIKLNSMNAWENDTTEFSYDRAVKLCETLKEEGVHVSADWLIKGMGDSPRVEKLAPPHIQENLHQDEEDAIWAEASRLKKYYKDCFVYIVHDDSCLPLYQPGDFLAGVIASQPEQAIGKVCLLELTNGAKIVREVINIKKNQCQAQCINSQSQLANHEHDTFDVKAVAPIIWFRRKIS